MDKSIIADPHSRYGNARSATRHFIVQRLTGALNVLFTIFFIWLVVRLAGTARADMVAVIANPWVAILTALLILSVVIHMRIGMREVIEDYVHDPRLYSLSLTLNSFFAIAIAVLGWLALIKIVFWG
ncbi:MAG TPA: succinate dehydrogenase, hydrophobic membrane anchor protein [Devosiaceae bacterium]|jgi:succinate dehydrogenase / fumarate reductase membrane anchor subunit